MCSRQSATLLLLMSPLVSSSSASLASRIIWNKGHFAGEKYTQLSVRSIILGRYLYFRFGQLFRLMAPSFPASLFYLPHQLLMKRRMQCNAMCQIFSWFWSRTHTARSHAQDYGAIDLKLVQKNVNLGEGRIMWTHIGLLNDIYFHIAVNIIVQGPQEVDQISQ